MLFNLSISHDLQLYTNLDTASTFKRSMSLSEIYGNNVNEIEQHYVSQSLIRVTGRSNLSGTQLECAGLESRSEHTHPDFS